MMEEEGKVAIFLGIITLMRESTRLTEVCFFFPSLFFAAVAVLNLFEKKKGGGGGGGRGCLERLENLG